MKNTPTINRIAGALQAIHVQGTTSVVETQDPPIKKGKSKRKSKDEELDEELDFGDNDIPIDDDWDDDDDDDDDEEEYMEELMEVATDPRASLIDGKVIFLRHPTNPDKMMMVAEVDEYLPPEFNLEGNEMWKGELILRLRKGREGATLVPSVPDPAVFKKKNFAKKI